MVQKNIKTSSKQIKRIQGVSLLEMIIVIILIGIIVQAFGPLMMNAARASQASIMYSNLYNQGLIAKLRLDRDLQSIRPPNFTLNANSITLENVSGDTASYTLSGTNLQRNGYSLAQNVVLLNFDYYDINGNSTTNINDVRFIKYSFTMQDNQTKTSETFSNVIFLRNFQPI